MVIPVNATEPQGKEVDICMFVDCDHAGNKVSADQEEAS